MMKRFLKQCAGVALAAALLAGCAGQQSGQGASALPASEIAPRADGAAVEKLLNGEHTLTSTVARAYMGTPMAESESGIYECVNRGEYYLLCRTDYATGTRAPLCSVEGCAHTDESCPAWRANWRELAVAGDWLLEGATGQDGAWTLDAQPLSGGERKNILSGVKEYVSLAPMAEEEGSLWLAVDGKAARVDPAAGTVEYGAALPEAFQPVGALGGCILHRTNDGYARLDEYYESTGDLGADAQQQQDILDRATVTLAGWDPRTGEDTPLAQWTNGDYDLALVWEGKLIRHGAGQASFEVTSLATGETAALGENWPAEQRVSSAYVRDGRLMVETSWEPEPDNSDTWKECMFALDLSSGELTEITLRNRGGQGTALARILGESEGEFYVICSTGSEEAPQGEMAVISKADFYAGVDSMVPIKDIF